MSTITMGVNLAKSVFAVCTVDAAGRVLARQEFKRDAFARWLAQVPACTIPCSARKPRREFFCSLHRQRDKGDNRSDRPGENLTNYPAVTACSG